ncbi:MAG: LysM peptidoglycan-binding domain-containing protein [Gammaproteobacteria bacterium]|nr:MAG: LysM peptidoglycan-binding domain-containing protein [Gammaproteobacteria bacterium]
MNTQRKSIHDADALVLYQVGPVYCCSPTLPVESVMMPPRLTQPPGSTRTQPGVFKYSSGIVHVVDLRKRFGVDEQDQVVPGRLIVVEVEKGHAGMWVDEIIDVIQFPTQGWGQVPAHIPRNVFSRTLLYDDKIMLYADFENLHKFRETGYLRQHIEALKKEAHIAKTHKSLADDASRKPSVTGTVEQAIHSGREKNTSNVANDKPGQDKESQQNIIHQSVIRPVSSGRESPLATSVNYTSRYAPTQQWPGAAAEKSRSKMSAEPEKQAAVVGSQSVERHSFATEHRSASIDHSRMSNDWSRYRSEDSDLQHAERSFISVEKIASDTQKENSLVMWGFGLVITAVIIMLAMHGMNLISNDTELTERSTGTVSTKSESAEDASVALSDLQQEADVRVDDQNNAGRVLLKNQSAPVNPYRADIANEAQNIVIVLQQPAGVEEVLNNDETGESVTEIADGVNFDISLNAKDKLHTSEVAGGSGEQVKASQPNAIVEQQAYVVKTDSKTLSVLNKNKSLVIEANNKVQTGKNKRVVHIVVKGDTLWYIAKRYIKDPFRYPELARLSKIKNPDLIYPGNKVIIVVDGEHP